MKIEVRQLKKLGGSGQPFSGELPREDGLFSDAEPIGPVCYSGVAEIYEDTVFLTGSAEAYLRSACDRCGKPVDLCLTADLSGRFVPEGFEERAEDDDVYGEDGFIDVSAFARDKIVLALPMRRLCSLNCKGLCPVCGMDLNAGACECKTDRSGKENPFEALTAVLKEPDKRK